MQKVPTSGRDVFIRSKTGAGFGEYSALIPLLARTAWPLRRRCFIQISALSTFDGTVVAYHGCNG